MKICPKHKETLFPKKTKYGNRYSCPVEKCTVVCWEGETSTPADLETRTWRTKAHEAFDILWKGQKSKRGYYYGLLSEELNKTPDQNHIGMFNIKKKKKTIIFAEKELSQRT